MQEKKVKISYRTTWDHAYSPEHFNWAQQTMKKMKNNVNDNVKVLFWDSESKRDDWD